MKHKYIPNIQGYISAQITLITSCHNSLKQSLKIVLLLYHQIIFPPKELGRLVKSRLIPKLAYQMTAHCLPTSGLKPPHKQSMVSHLQSG